jgi:hypothetical protein
MEVGGLMDASPRNENITQKSKKRKMRIIGETWPK